MNAALAWSNKRMSETRGEYHTGSGETSAAADTGKIVDLAGCMTGDAGEVNRRLKQISYGSQVTRFLRQLEDMTFSKAGLHRKWGHANPGSWCWFELAGWATELNLHKSTLLHVRKRLIEDGLIWFEPHTETPGVGRIGWNLKFSEWRPLQPDYRTWGGARSGAGRRSIKTQPAIDNLNESVGNLKTDNSSYQQNVSSYQRMPDENAFKLPTVACSEDGQEAAPREAPIKGYENKEKIEANASSAATSADATPAPVNATAHTSPSQPSEPQETKTSRRPRKLTDDQLAAHRAEQGWCSALLADYRTELGVATLPSEGKERAAAHWFYAQLQDVEDGAAKVMACYRLTKRDPFWQNRPLSLQKLTELFTEYRRDPAGYRARIEQARTPRPAYAARAAPNEPKPLPVRRELARDAKPAPLD